MQSNQPDHSVKINSSRLTWLDVTRGLAILWIVYFHLFGTYIPKAPSPILPNFISNVAGDDGFKNLSHACITFLKVLGLSASTLGFHAVSVFLIVSGFVLYQSMWRRSQRGSIAWWQWYRQKLFRLYPMYWIAHLVYLLSPFTARLEPLDDRFWISLLGFRFFNIESNFFYLNAAWWYFSLLIQLYLLFPLLFISMRHFGTDFTFGVALAVGFIFRYLLLNVYHQSGLWVQGGFGLSRLPEFAFGIALGSWYLRYPDFWNRFLFNGKGLLLGLLSYPIAIWFYHDLVTYTFVDFLTGLCLFLILAGLSRLFEMGTPFLARSLVLAGSFSYGIFLIHQPYIITLGEMLRSQPLSTFAIVGFLGIILISAWGIVLERSANYLLQRFF